MNKPNILDPRFKYTSAAKTDISKTFARIRRELKNSGEGQENNKPLVSSPALLPNGFVLTEDWFQME
jgi:hypothetical protein